MSPGCVWHTRPPRLGGHSKWWQCLLEKESSASTGYPTPHLGNVGWLPPPFFGSNRVLPNQVMHRRLVIAWWRRYVGARPPGNSVITPFSNVPFVVRYSSRCNTPFSRLRSFFVPQCPYRLPNRSTSPRILFLFWPLSPSPCTCLEILTRTLHF